MTASGLRRYAESKLWGMMFMLRLQSRLDAEPSSRHVGTLMVDPGGVFSTNIMREQTWIWRRPLRTVLRLVTSCVQLAAPNGALRTARKAATDFLGSCFAVDGVVGKRPKGLHLEGNVAIIQ